MKGQTEVEIRLDTGAQWSMPLTGEAFTHRNQTAPTQDSGATGRWIASDESGWDGEQLWGRGRYLVVASVAIDDAEAAAVVAALREQAGIRQAPELKFARFKDRANRCEALRLLWGPGGALHERCAVYVVDKEYAVAAKVIDMLLEERAHAMGIDLYAGGLARELARTLALKGQRMAQGENLSALMAAFVALASHRGRRRQQEAADVFFHELDQAWATTDHPGVKEILAALRGTRSQADTLHLPEYEEPFPAMEMLVPSVAQIARLWAARLGPGQYSFDRQRTGDRTPTRAGGNGAPHRPRRWQQRPYGRCCAEVPPTTRRFSSRTCSPGRPPPSPGAMPVHHPPQATTCGRSWSRSSRKAACCPTTPRRALPKGHSPHTAPEALSLLGGSIAATVLPFLAPLGWGWCVVSPE